MKKDRAKIDYNETGTFKVNKVSERYFYKYFEQQTGPYIKALFHSAYQICNVYTNQNTVLNAYQKLNGYQATNQVFLDHNDALVSEEYHSIIRSQILLNDQFNCHGFTFLESQFWFELDNETADIIISEDNYQLSDYENLRNNGVCLFYNEHGQLIHSAKKVNGLILSKFGINDLITNGIDEIFKRYVSIDKSRTKYFNLSE